MFYFALGELPDSWLEVLFLPVFFAIVGTVIWIAGRKAEIRDNAKPWKWAAAAPFFLAVCTGWGPFMRIRDTFYRAALEGYGKKMELAHYGALLLPLLCVAGLGAWEWFEQTRVRHEN